MKTGVGIAIQVDFLPRGFKNVLEIQQPLRGRAMNKDTRPYE